MTKPKTFTVLVPSGDVECIDWCWSQFGAPQFLREGSPARWTYGYHHSEKTAVQLIFFAEADYQLFKDTGMETWSWLKDQ